VLGSCVGRLLLAVESGVLVDNGVVPALLRQGFKRLPKGALESLFSLLVLSFLN